MRIIAVAALLACLAGAPLAAQQSGPAAAAAVGAPVEAPVGARAFAAFLGYSAPLCLREAAERCVEAGWRFADRDRNGRLNLTEFETVRGELREWLAWPDNGVAPHEKRGVLLGLMIVETLGFARLIESYDGDADGAISRDELLSDVRLDQRPLGEVLSDSKSVDWEALRQRLGALAPALGTIVPGATE